MNVNDSDGGALVGLWSGNNEDYADGTEPTSWSGSEAILQEYITTKRPVKYAQCWVFGGTLTTSKYEGEPWGMGEGREKKHQPMAFSLFFSIFFGLALRTLGVPARPVTNFRSAHDANANRAIDYYYNHRDMPVEEKSDDSVW